MKDKFSYVAAFDLDKTIVTVNSSSRIVKAARKTGLMSKKDFLHAIIFSIVYKFDLKDANKIVEDMTKWLRGIKEAEVIKLIEDHVLQRVLGLIRPEMNKVIDQHRKGGARLVLLSSAMPYICNPMASYLKMDDIVCSALEVEDGRFTGKPVNRLNFGTQKAVTMKQFCEENGYSMDDAYYYGDAFTDRFVMDAVGHAVAVKPELKLKRMARRKGWQVI